MSTSRPCLGFVAAIALFAAACGTTVRTDGPTLFFPPEPDAPRLQYLRSVTADMDIIERRSGLDTMLFGEQGVERALITPYGVTFHDGVFYVADLVLGMIVTIDIANREFDALRLEGPAAPQKPVNLVFTEDGRLFVADLGRSQVLVYDEEFRLIHELGPWGDESRPVDVDVFGDRLYITDAGDPMVRVLDLHSYEELFAFGRDGDDPTKMVRGPSNLTHDRDGNSYVSDAIRLRISVFAADGSWLRNIGKAGDIAGSFSRPKGVTILDDMLFVVDAAFENCQILDLEGRPLMFFGGSGVAPSQFYLPAGVWVGREGLELFENELADGFEPEALIAVTNFYGPHKLSFFALGKHRDYDYSIYETPVEAPESTVAPEAAAATDG